MEKAIQEFGKTLERMSNQVYILIKNHYLITYTLIQSYIYM